MTTPVYGVPCNGNPHVERFKWVLCGLCILTLVFGGVNYGRMLKVDYVVLVDASVSYAKHANHSFEIKWLFFRASNILNMFMGYFGTH